MRVEFITSIIGGIGLFILGMILMTEGLKSLAGDTLRRGLSRFTGGRISSILSGAGITALLQSSHATIITTIGFVSAGLITFEQSLGIILGAHLGTTSTGWLVSILGMKLKLGALALPVAGIGAFMRLLGRDRVASIGLLCAGFGLIFFGIDLLQGGMKHCAGYLDLAGLGGTGILNRLILVAIGIAMTVILQASSAAVVMTMAALGSGAIDLVQASALVIGQNIGTTLTAAIAAFGATSSARRTAMAHILFNVVTGFIAFVILPYFLSIVQTAIGVFGIVDPAITLAAFHSAFNILGIIIILPFIRQFSHVLVRIIPERGPYLTRLLDNSLINVPSVALETVRRTIIDITIASIDIVRDMIQFGDVTPGIRTKLREAGNALNDTRRFLGQIKTIKGAATAYGNRLMYVLHAVDHVDQLIIACWEFNKLTTMRKDTGLNNLACMLADNMEPVLVRLEGLKKKESIQEMERTSQYMKGLRQREREDILKRTASGRIDPDTAMRQIEAIRWLDRVIYRIFRALYYLGYHTEEGLESAYGEELNQ
ncbi:MAG: Na/Pi cotransporter family protein [Spirochaetes bacterium]|nr:Na/Pi cotransporter family protein [Spirochaetota bacterium]HOD15933.1 Na/Pi symporter [Spirochaetota bacterium]